MSSQDAGFDQQLPDHVRIAARVLDALDIGGQMAGRRQDAQGAVLAHEFEHVLDGLLVGLAFELDHEAEVAGFRIELRKLGQLAVIGGKRNDVADGREVTNEGKRVHAVAQHVEPELQRDVPAIAFHHAAAAGFDRRITNCRRGGFRRGDAQVTSERCQQGFARAFLFGIECLTGFRHHRNQQRNMIATLEQQLDQVTIYRQFAFSQLVEHILDHMGEGHDGVEAKQPGRTLDGMGSAEQGIDGIVILQWLVFELQQDIFHFLQQPAAFFDIGL